jgi:phosphoglucosamine mutase
MFGTDGVRGVANKELTVELAMQLGRYGAHVITGRKRGAKILVGADTRISGEMLENALIAGILSSGCDVIKLGVIPTPAVAKLVRLYQADAGVMISASHNPAEFNGIKFFNSEGLKLSDAVEDEIEAEIKSQKPFDLPVGGALGRISFAESAKETYVKSVLETYSGPSLDGMRVVLDCANGAASEVAPMAIRALGAEVIALHNTPDGININAGCGSTHMDDLMAQVKAHNAHVGLAFDGDADRLLAVDENGQFVDGDKIMAICGQFLKVQNQLAENTIVTTVMTNLGFDIAMKENGMKTVKTQVGDRYVLENMLANGYELGGEQSGHIIFLRYNTTGDGLLTAVQLLRVMRATEKSLSELANIMTVYPQVLKNAKVANHLKQRYMENELIAERIRQVEQDFSGKGRVLIRPSGTEPLVRVMIEGSDLGKLEQTAVELTALIEAQLSPEHN